MNCFSEGVVGASLLLLLMEGTGQSHIFKVFAEGYMFESYIKSSFSRRNIFIRLCYENYCLLVKAEESLVTEYECLKADTVHAKCSCVLALHSTRKYHATIPERKGF